jgi:hypothetical protein
MRTDALPAPVKPRIEPRLRHSLAAVIAQYIHDLAQPAAQQRGVQ